MVSTSLPNVDPVDTSSGTGSDDNTTTTSTDLGNGDNGGGATVTTPTDTIKNEPILSIVEPIIEKPETGYEKAERYANLSIRWAIVLVMLALTYNLAKQYRVPKPTTPTA